LKFFSGFIRSLLFTIVENMEKLPGIPGVGPEMCGRKERIDHLLKTWRDVDFDDEIVKQVSDNFHTVEKFSCISQ
jgi:hypothetical protein